MFWLRRRRAVFSIGTKFSEVPDAYVTDTKAEGSRFFRNVYLSTNLQAITYQKAIIFRLYKTCIL